jgi:hypothetical protein
MKEGLFYPGLGSEGLRPLRPDCDRRRSAGAFKEFQLLDGALACDFGKYCQRKGSATHRIITDAEQRVLLKPAATIVELLPASAQGFWLTRAHLDAIC